MQVSVPCKKKISLLVWDPCKTLTQVQYLDLVNTFYFALNPLSFLLVNPLFLPSFALFQYTLFIYTHKCQVNVELLPSPSLFH